MVRLMVTSATYRQSSVETPALRERDPLNKLFARQARFRLDAEFVRDNALAVSGLLEPRRSAAPSVKPYQPAGYWAALNFPTREWQKDTGREGLPPRPLHPLAADVPAPGAARVRRPEPRGVHRRAAAVEHPAAGAGAAERPDVRRGGARLRRRRRSPTAATNDAARVAWAFERATGRKPTAAEAAVLARPAGEAPQGLRGKTRRRRRSCSRSATRPRPKDVAPAELAAWTSVCRVDPEPARDDHAAVRCDRQWHDRICDSLATTTSLPTTSRFLQHAAVPRQRLSRRRRVALARSSARPRAGERQRPAASSPSRTSRRRPSGSSSSYMAGGPCHLERSTTSRSSPKLHGQPMPESFTKGQPIAQLQGAKLNCFGPQYELQEVRQERAGDQRAVPAPAARSPTTCASSAR